MHGALPPLLPRVEVRLTRGFMVPATVYCGLLSAVTLGATFRRQRVSGMLHMITEADL
jgi:hypothetical protein